MKTVGIIGGLGPQTSAKFYLEIISSCLKNNKSQRPKVLIWSVPMWIKLEKNLILGKEPDPQILNLLVNTAKGLEKAGADFLVMPCNTMHIFIEKIRNAVNIPILSIVDETFFILKKRSISKIGLLGTSTTINKNLFTNSLNDIGIKQITPQNTQQKKLDKIISNLVLGKHSIEDEIDIERIIEQMINLGIREIILACTDLQLIVKPNSQIEIIDTMQILAEATVKNILKGGD